MVAPVPWGRTTVGPVRRAKIVCTLGPATDSPEVVRGLIAAGMDVARFNMSHGTHADHDRRFALIRELDAEVVRPIAVLADLQGPKIRLGTMADGPVELAPGDTFTITTRDVAGDRSSCSTTYAGLPQDAKAGDVLLIDDGKIVLRVEQVDGPDVTTTVVEGGPISSRKGINLPGAAVNVPALSPKDEDDLRWALRTGVDLVALSFVRDAADIESVHRIMDEHGHRLPVIAKLEKPQAIDNLQQIVDAFDGIMVARGDLGVELPLWEVPLVQKRAVELARRRAKPVIVATQMLESMITNSRPTRAEASDVANAVLDGADAVMLSGETSVGAFPVQAVETMAHIVEATEQDGLDRIPRLTTRPRTPGGAITLAAADTGILMGAQYLAAFTRSGDSARRLSRLRSAIPMVAFTPLEATRRQLALVWGVQAFVVDVTDRTDQAVEQVDRALAEQRLAQHGDLIVIVYGTPPGHAGTTNTMLLHRIGDPVEGVIPTAPAGHDD
jgi:pyruvate kinase